MTKDEPQNIKSGDKTTNSYRLNTISFSHYNEKARFALDYYGIPYIEYRALPVLHGLSMFKYRVKGVLRVPDALTPFTTPILIVTPTGIDGTPKKKEKFIVRDSTGILNFLADQYGAPSDALESTDALPNLYTTDKESRAKILEMEERFDSVIGINVRLYVYYEILLRSPKSVGRSLGTDNAGTLQQKLWSLGYPFFGFFLRRVLNITEESAATSKEAIKQEFDRISQILDSRPPEQTYLFGNHFTAADLTLACLAAPMVGITHVEGYGATIPMDKLRPEALEFMNELKDTTAGKYISEIYRRHRGQKASGSSYGYHFFGRW